MVRPSLYADGGPAARARRGPESAPHPGDAIIAEARSPCNTLADRGSAHESGAGAGATVLASMGPRLKNRGYPSRARARQRSRNPNVLPGTVLPLVGSA